MVDDGRQPTRTPSVIDEALDSVIHTRAAVLKAIRKTKTKQKQQQGKQSNVTLLVFSAQSWKELLHSTCLISS